MTREELFTEASDVSEAKGDLFDGAEVISVYTDADAVDDGVLVDIGGDNRVTTALWEWLVKHTPETPPDRWPVDLMRFVSGDRPLAMARGLILAHGDAARRIHEHNVGGGIWSELAIVRDGEIVGLATTPTETAAFKGDDLASAIWLLPNEVGGLTLMFPGDY